MLCVCLMSITAFVIKNQYWLSLSLLFGPSYSPEEPSGSLMAKFCTALTKQPLTVSFWCGAGSELLVLLVRKQLPCRGQRARRGSADARQTVKSRLEPSTRNIVQKASDARSYIWLMCGHLLCEGLEKSIGVFVHIFLTVCFFFFA